MISFLLLNWFLWPIVKTQFNLYNTDVTLDVDRLQIHCLYLYDWFRFHLLEKSEFCLSLTNISGHIWNDNFINIRDRNFTFNELRQLKITSNQLLLWSATIDLVEKYQYYIDYQNNSYLSEEIFFNCTKPWFGPRCQYSLVWSEIYSFERIIQEILAKRLTDTSSNTITNVTCYVHLKCDRGGAGLCLDWREVCDGRIDCIDGGADEAQCFELEMNECNENEYRCHDGLCISKEFLEDENIYCLDRSDRQKGNLIGSIFDGSIIFDWKFYSCKPGYEQFSCGDGQCVADFDQCNNTRHLMLKESISIQGNLSYTCWMMMICLTKILDQINGTSCNQFLQSIHISDYLETYEDLIQFPIVPVLFGHIRFLYRLKGITDLNIDVSLTPDYICYDQQLCDFLKPTYFHKNYSCRKSHEFDFNWNIKPKNWTSLIQVVERYFRKCLTRYPNNKNYSHHPSLYCCKNSSKCISKHRILDSISDCYLNDDEEEQFELSCLVHDILRFKCNNENKCYSSLFSEQICSSKNLRTFNEIYFQDICDRHVQIFPIIINEQNYTDESECEDWPCSNINTRCDGFWSCSDGKDEDNCTNQICPTRTFACISRYNYSLICLSANQVDDQHIGCLGAIDEQQHCRNYDYLDETYPTFRCWEDDKCVWVYDLCNGKIDCPHGDDETFCENHYKKGICYEKDVDNRTEMENVLCFSENTRRLSFSIKSSLFYSTSESRTIQHTPQRSIERHSIPNFSNNAPYDHLWLWRCNHGLYVRHWLGNNNFDYKCFCPSNYYGELCQYQSQLVSFTAKVRSLNASIIYAIIVTLIDDSDDHQEINSYHQFSFRISSTYRDSINAYLTYLTQPNNSSKNYSVRIEVFNRISLTYLASWHLTIPFSFLPIYHMTITLYIPTQSAITPKNCPLNCQNGDCKKYINKEMFFCRCYRNWTGNQCNIPIDCSDCSPDSECIGKIHNRSICVCPLLKSGPRCLLTILCSQNKCLNGGQCIVHNDGMDKLGTTCICPEEFYGPDCGYQRETLEISFHEIKIPSFLLIYIFANVLHRHFDASNIKVIPQKLTMFQRTVLVHIALPFNMVFVQINDNYYLTVLLDLDIKNISTTINSNQRCAFINEVLNGRLVNLHEIRRVKYYHLICQTHTHLTCFFDKPYMCLCTTEHQASCFKFEVTPPKCLNNIHCLNGGECWQDHPIIPAITICTCIDCFFGDRCQYYAKGIGLTLDDILRYEIRSNVSINNQTVLIKWSLTLTMIMFTVSLINSILSILTFSTKQSRDVGCGLYLLASSITSLLTMIMFTIKFWFLILTQINPLISYSIHRGGCKSIEFILKICLYSNNWLNVCVAFERSITVYKGIHFNKILSKYIAKKIIFILPLLIMISIIYEPIYRDLTDDKEEQRLWCVFYYLHSVHIYNTIILFFHHIMPFCANLFSALFIISGSARRRAILQKQYTYRQHLQKQFKEHKNLIISPIILVILALPRLIISFFSGCVKVSYNSLLYISGYLISFIPSMTIFFVFVLPSDFYRKQFKKSINSYYR